MSLDIARLRAETPGCAHVLHLNAAGSALPSQRTLDATLGRLDFEAEIGGYEAADGARETLNGFYPSVARLIGAEAGRDRLRRECHARLGHGVLFARLQTGRPILTCVSEYSSNYISYLQVAKKTGAELVVVPDDSTARSTSARWSALIDKTTKLVSIPMCRRRAGWCSRPRRSARSPRRPACIYLLDACQSVGQLPVDMQKIDCDFASVTGRKYMRGPRGTGFLYARKSTTSKIEPIFLDNHAARWTGDNEYTAVDSALRFENWERYFAGVVGLKVATDQINELGIDADLGASARARGWAARPACRR